MRIAYIANSQSIHTLKWVLYFQEHGYDCRIFDKNIDKIDKILRGINKFNPNIVHSHYAGWNGLIGSLTNKHPYVVTVWGSDVIGNYGNFFKRQVVKYGLQKADVVTTDAEHIMVWLARYGVSHSKIHRINFGVDTELFKPNKITHKGKVVVSLRSLEKIYDVETLIRAVPYVVKEINDVLFKIYGNGSQRDYLEKLASKLGVSDYVEFCGEVEYAEIPKVLNSADLYVSTALSDAGLASSTAEAMACGLTCISSDIKGIEEYPVYVFNKRNFSDLAKLIVGLLDNEFLHVNDGRKYIVKLDNYLIEMAKMDELYQKLINEKNT